MLGFLARRIALAIPVLFGATLLAFIVIRVVPGDPVTVLLSGRPTTPEVEAQLRHQFYLDRSPPMQYLLFLRDLGQGDLGISMRTGNPVREDISDRLPATLKLTGFAFALALLVGLVLGLAGSLLRSRLVDRLLTGVQVASVSVPPVWLGLLLLIVGSFQLGWFPATGDEGWESLVLPAITLALPSGAVVGQVLRDGVREAAAEQYVITARSKGLAERQITIRHILRNALMPVITVSGLIAGSLITGSVVIESVFARPGVGRLAVDAITNKDTPVVMGIVLLAATVYIVVNIVVDILYAVADPRNR
jgi:ABC-type dipeptide/oligopeptide/nickel transport system permease component